MAGLEELLPAFYAGAQPEFESIYGADLSPEEAEALVIQMYQGVLGRPPSAEEIQMWAPSLLSDPNGVQTMLEGFFTSPEYQSQPHTSEETITDLYEGLFGRTPDASELPYWTPYMPTDPAKEEAPVPEVTQPAPGTFTAEDLDDPQAVKDFISPEPYTLPMTTEADQAFRDLQLQAAAELEALMSQDWTEQQTTLANQMYGLSSEAINENAAKMGQDINEGTFGRGVGLSSITVDLQDQLYEDTLDALSQAQQESWINAGNETRAQQEAQLAAYNTAFNLGTSGLNLDTSVGMTNTGRDQEAATTAVNTAKDVTLTQEELESREDLTEDELNAQLIAAGMTAGVAGLEEIFGADVWDEITKSLYGVV